MKASLPSISKITNVLKIDMMILFQVKMMMNKLACQVEHR